MNGLIRKARREDVDALVSCEFTVGHEVQQDWLMSRSIPVAETRVPSQGDSKA